MNKLQLKTLVAQDKLGQVLNALLEITAGLGNDLYDESVQLAARFAAYEKDLHARRVSAEHLETRVNTIRSALNYLINQLPDQEFTVSPAIFTDSTAADPGPSVPAASPDSTVKDPLRTGAPEPPRSNIPWIVGLALLLLGMLFLTLKSCPTEPQFFAIRLLLALGAGGLATMLPGMLKIEHNAVAAGGAVGMSVLVFLVNPAKLIVADDCGNHPFDFTVSVLADRSIGIPASYPAIGNSVLLLRLGNEWKPDTLDAQSDADFKNIAGDYRNHKVACRLLARYWMLTSDSVLLSGKSQVVWARPNGSLQKIRGKVMDSKTGAPLPGATIEVLGVTALSNVTGNFELEIPLEKQLMNDYEVNAYKDGFEPWKGNATPATGAPISILLVTARK